MHWVDAKHAIPAEFRLYDSLLVPNVDNDELMVDEKLDETEGALGELMGKEDKDKSFLKEINPNSLEVLQGFVEPNMKNVTGQDKFQFFRHGYFNVDPKFSTPEKAVYNLIVSLKSSFKM